MVRVRSLGAVAAVVVSAVSLSAITNCGGSTTNATTGSSTSGSSSSGSAAESAQPPPAPAAKAGDGPAGGLTFAVSQLFIGDTNPCTPTGGAVSCNAIANEASGWEQFGYDLDGQDDTPTTAKHCKPVDAAPKSVFTNGNNGIDNSFGRNILPILHGIASDASSKINADITSGKFSILIQVEQLGTGSNYSPLTSQLFVGTDLPSAPKFNGTDNWPVSPALLNPPGTAISDGSQVQFKTSYVANNTWVSGGKGTVTLALAISSVTLNLQISNALLSFQMDATHHHVTGGVIAGVLQTSELTSTIRNLAGNFDQSLCSGTTIDSILTEISQASDILADGTQDPSQTCDGISIGLGFNAELVENPSIVAPKSTPAPSKCGDAGM